MSMHPNTLLLAVLKPLDDNVDSFEIMKKYFSSGEDENYGYVTIKQKDYTCKQLIDGYDEDYQIEVDEGDIVLFTMVTYGYADKTPWNAVKKQELYLSDWLFSVRKEINCSYEIYLTANMW
jgi:hypothetical protein